MTNLPFATETAAVHDAMPTLKQVPAVPDHGAAMCKIPGLSRKLPDDFSPLISGYADRVLDLNSYVIPNKGTSFFFDVQDDSWSSSGICEGDKLLVDQSVSAESGRLVVAIISSQYVLMRLFSSHGMLVLKSEHPDVETVICKKADDPKIWGVVTAVVRKFPT